MTRRLHVPIMVAVALGIAGVAGFGWTRHAVILVPVLLAIAFGLTRAGLHRMGVGALVADMRRPLVPRRSRNWLRLGEEGGLVALALLAWRRYHARHSS